MFNIFNDACILSELKQHMRGTKGRNSSNGSLQMIQETRDFRNGIENIRGGKKLVEIALSF
jgi:hypothetical protein